MTIRSKPTIAESTNSTICRLESIRSQPGCPDSGAAGLGLSACYRENRNDCPMFRWISKTAVNRPRAISSC
jgi:hypothetical protein